MRYYLELGNIQSMLRFKKFFENEFDRDKFARRLKYSKKLVVLEKGEE